MCGIQQAMIVFAAISGHSNVGSPLADAMGALGGLFFFIALVLTCIGLVDKYVIHRGRAAVLHPRLRLFACIFGVTGLLGIIVPLLVPAIYAVRHAAEVRNSQVVAGDYDKAIADLYRGHPTRPEHTPWHT